MSKFVVIVFPSEAQAYEGTRALTELHAEGSLTLYGMAVIAKDAEANVSIKESADAGPLETAIGGALVGGLVGVIGGPVGALAGVTAGGLMGSIADLFNYGVGADFVARKSRSCWPPAGPRSLLKLPSPGRPLWIRAWVHWAVPSCGLGAPTSRMSRSPMRLPGAGPT